MAGRLRDLKRQRPSVTIGNVELEVRALSLGQLAGLISDHPDLARILDGEPIADVFRRCGGDLVDQVIAEGTGETLEDVRAAELTWFEQLEIALKVAEASLPADEAALGNMAAQVQGWIGKLERAAETMPETASASGPQSSNT